MKPFLLTVTSILLLIRQLEACICLGCAAYRTEIECNRCCTSLIRRDVEHLANLLTNDVRLPQLTCCSLPCRTFACRRCCSAQIVQEIYDALKWDGDSFIGCLGCHYYHWKIYFGKKNEKIAQKAKYCCSHNTKFELFLWKDSILKGPRSARDTSKYRVRRKFWYFFFQL